MASPLIRPAAFLVPTHAQTLRGLPEGVIAGHDLGSLDTLYFNAAALPWPLRRPRFVRTLKQFEAGSYGGVQIGGDGGWRHGGGNRPETCVRAVT